jgi:hypothetical protein
MLGRLSTLVHPTEWLLPSGGFALAPDLDFDPAVVRRVRLERFGDLAQAWNNYIAEHAGHIPADPYRELFYAAKLTDGRALQEIDFLPDLPPRVNPNLRENGKWVIFSGYSELDGPERWQFYADGTWACMKLPAGIAFAPASFGMSFDPHQRLRDAGYPVDQWTSDADRAAWLARNEDRMVWYPPWRMYVVRGAPAMRPTPGTP